MRDFYDLANLKLKDFRLNSRLNIYTLSYLVSDSELQQVDLWKKK